MIERCPNCGEKIECLALTSNPPIYKNICKNCGEIGKKLKLDNCCGIITPMEIKPTAKIYLIWERESYCDYDITYITLNKLDAELMFENLKRNCKYDRYSLEEKELNKFYNIEW